MPSPQALAAAHLAGDPLAAAWLGVPWSGIRSTADHARGLLAAGRWDRPALARLAGSKPVAALLAAPESVVVVTGQQPAVGGGPLYSLVKTAHAIALARRLGDEGIPAVAWFWCASEDHDLGEANHADLLLRDGSIARVGADLGPGRAALRWRPASLWFDLLAARCRNLFGAGLGTRWLEEHAPIGDEGTGAWLCRVVADLWAGQPLAVCEAHQLRPLWRGALAGAIRAWPVQALDERRHELLAHGYADPFGPLPAAPLFADRREGRIALDPQQALALAASEPDLLSPGAALRPVLQQIALPAAAAILGPGELAYHAAIGPVYAALGAQRPQLVPRCSLTLLPPWTARAAQRLGLSPEELADGAAPVAEPPHDPRSDRLTALAHAIDRVGDPADRRIAAAQARLRNELERLRSSLARGARAAAGLPPPGAVAGLLRPRGRRQERSMSLFQAVWEHGPGVAAELLHAADATAPGQHRLVRLGG